MKISEEHFFFDSMGFKLYGTLYKPLTILENTKSYLILHPFAEERKTSQKVLVDISRGLCINGNYVMLFDYFGCGESEGDLEDANLSHWLNDIEKAARFLITNTNSENINIIGLRLGAFLGVIYAQDSENVNELICIEPVTNPKRDFNGLVKGKLIKELVTDKNTTIKNDVHERLNNGESIDLSGYKISNEFYSSLIKFSDTKPFNELIRYKSRVLLLNVSQFGLLSREFKKLIMELKENTFINNKLIKLEPFWRQIELPNYSELLKLVIAWSSEKK